MAATPMPELRLKLLLTLVRFVPLVEFRRAKLRPVYGARCERAGLVAAPDEGLTTNTTTRIEARARNGNPGEVS
jgi:hypothetical protein